MEYTCRVCGKSYGSKSQILGHLQSHVRGLKMYSAHEFVSRGGVPVKPFSQKPHVGRRIKKPPINLDWIKSPEFYRSDAWRKLRYEAIVKYGNKCKACGASPDTGAVIHVDHIKSRHNHPELALKLSNLQILCSECNLGKGWEDKTRW